MTVLQMKTVDTCKYRKEGWGKEEILIPAFLTLQRGGI
jgi:hypothetical protein